MTHAETLRQLAQKAQHRAETLKHDHPFNVIEHQMAERERDALLAGAQALDRDAQPSQTDGEAG